MKSENKLTSALVVALVLAMLAAYGVLRSGGATVRGNELNVDRAIFAVVNATTLTGFQLSVNVNDYKLPGQITIFVLIAVGSLISLIVGGSMLNRILTMRFTDRQIAGFSISTWIILILVAASALMRPGTNAPAAIFQAASAFGNAGHVIGALPGWMDWRMHLVLLPLGLIGGMGILVVMDLAMAIAQRRRLHPYTVAVLAMTAAVYLIGLFFIAGIEWLDGKDFQQAAVIGSSVVMNSRTLGFPLDTFGMLARPSQWIVLILMAIGGSGAGTAGGIKVTTVFGIGRGVVRAILGESIDRIFGVICVWFGIYCLMVLATTMLLSACEPQAAGDRLLFWAVSAISNVGLSHEPITFTGMTLYVLSAAMVLGRVVPLGILWWTAERGIRAEI